MAINCFKRKVYPYHKILFYLSLGDVVLNKLVLKQSALDDFNLPVKTVAGHIGIFCILDKTIITSTNFIFILQMSLYLKFLGQIFMLPRHKSASKGSICLPFQTKLLCMMLKRKGLPTKKPKRGN